MNGLRKSLRLPGLSRTAAVNPERTLGVAEATRPMLIRRLSKNAKFSSLDSRKGLAARSTLKAKNEA